MRATHLATFATSRLEAFTDGVIAVIITITVLDIKAPHGTAPRDLVAIAPVFITYAISFVYVGIYWNNHHHFMRAASAIDARVMWANMHLLFWLSLVPFATTWVGENHEAPLPTALYGGILLMAALAFLIMQNRLVAINGPASRLAIETRDDRKGKVSLALYVLAIVAAFFATWISDVAIVAVAVMWFIPDRRAERAIVYEGGE